MKVKKYNIVSVQSSNKKTFGFTHRHTPLLRPKVIYFQAAKIQIVFDFLQKKNVTAAKEEAIKGERGGGIKN